jgi:WD40 repeat protein
MFIAALALLISGPSLAGAERPAAERLARTDTRGDPLPPSARSRLGTLRWRHSAGVLYVAYTPDGKQILSASQDGTLRLWEVDTGREVRRLGKEVTAPNMNGGPVDANAWLAYSRGLITSAAIAPDGKSAVSTVQEGTITHWDLASGQAIRQFKASNPTGIFALALSPDGKLLVTLGHDQIARLWDLAEGKELRKFNEQPNNQPRRLFFRGGPGAHVFFAADGATVYAGAMELENNRYNAVVKRWETATGKELPTLKGPQGGYQSLAFAPDGKTFIWGDNTGTFRVWDLAEAKEVRTFGGAQQGGFANALAFSADGKQLAARSYDGTIHLWDVAAGKELRQLGAQLNAQNFGFAVYGGFALSNMAFAPDGKYLASGVGGNTVGQWETATGKKRDSSGGHHGPVFNLAVSADGQTVATRASDNSVHLWDSTTGKETKQFVVPSAVNVAAFSQDGRRLLLGGYDLTLRLWDVEAGKELHQWRVPQTANLFGGNNMIVCVALSPDGKVAATRGGDQVIRLWDPVSGKELRHIIEMPEGTGANVFFAAHNNNMPAPRLTFAPDGATIAALPLEGTLIELNTGRQTPLDATIRLWDTTTGKLVRRFDTPKNKPAAFAFSRDGGTLATGNGDSTMSLWEVASGKERFSFKTGAAGSLMAVAFAPDGKTLTGAGQGQTIGIWDALNGTELAQLKGHQGAVVSLAFAADGKTLVSGGWDTTALVWDLAVERKHSLAELNAQQADALWADLASGDARRAFDALRSFLAAPRQTTMLMQERLRPVAPLDEQHVARLLSDLDSNVFIVRQRATNELENLGERIEPDLKRVLTDATTLELRLRIERLLEKLTSGAAPAPEVLRTLRAVEVLERIGTPEARQILDSLTHGAAGARLTRQAKATLERLGR